MKILETLVVVLLIVLVIFVSVSALVVRFWGQALFEDVLNSIFKQRVTIGAVHYVFPFGIQTNDMDIEGIGRFVKVSAYISVRSLSDRSLRFSYIYLDGPSVRFDRDGLLESASPLLSTALGEQGTDPLSAMVSVLSTERTPGARERKNSFLVEGLYIRHGEVRFFFSLFEKNVPVVIKEIWCEARDLRFPLSRESRVPFVLNARLETEESPLFKKQVEAKGWVNVINKEMDATITLSGGDDPFGLTASLKSVHNEMNVDGELNGVDFSALKNGGAIDESSVGKTVVDVLAQSQVAVRVKFSFATKMDDFKIEKIKFSGQIETHETF